LGKKSKSSSYGEFAVRIALRKALLVMKQEVDLGRRKRASSALSVADCEGKVD
jgi:hypothetical protein